MAETGDTGAIPRESDVGRVAEEVATRLRARGIEVHGEDSPTDLAMLLDAVEDFELAVEAQGGDLMTAEPPGGHPGDPVDFVLPPRTERESANRYVERLAEHTRTLRTRAD